MTDTTNPWARLDAALETMRHSKRGGSIERITMEAVVVCAEALSLLVDAHVPARGAKPEPEAEPEPEADPRESLPDDTPVGHGWAAGRDGWDLFKRESDGSFTRWTVDKWGATGNWEESEMVYTRPATVGDLRSEGLPVTEWPDITAPEPEQAEPQQSTVVLVYGEAWQRIIDHWYVVGEETGLTWAELCQKGTPTVIHTPPATA